MVSYFESLFGSYSPIVTLVSGSAETFDAVYEVSTNWSAVFSYIMVAILLYSICRIVGLLFGSK